MKQNYFLSMKKKKMIDFICAIKIFNECNCLTKSVRGKKCGDITWEIQKG